MQETQYEIRLAEEDKRWMTFAALSNEATLNSVLTPFLIVLSGLPAWMPNRSHRRNSAWRWSR